VRAGRTPEILVRHTPFTAASEGRVMRHDQEHDEQQLVHVIHKSAKQEIRVSVSTYRGKRFLDLRTFVIDRSGVFIPTRLGVTLPPEQLDELELALRKLRDLGA
jgi:hypothetical protein